LAQSKKTPRVDAGLALGTTASVCPKADGYGKAVTPWYC
jgi:hypothetical protein